MPRPGWQKLQETQRRMVFSSHARVTKTSTREGFLDRKIKIKEMNDGVILAEPVFHDADFIWGRHTSALLFGLSSETVLIGPIIYTFLNLIYAALTFM